MLGDDAAMRCALMFTLPSLRRCASSHPQASVKQCRAMIIALGAVAYSIYSYKVIYLQYGVCSLNPGFSLFGAEKQK